MENVFERFYLHVDNEVDYDAVFNVVRCEECKWHTLHFDGDEYPVTTYAPTIYPDAELIVQGVPFDGSKDFLLFNIDLTDPGVRRALINSGGKLIPVRYVDQGGERESDRLVRRLPKLEALLFRGKLPEQHWVCRPEHSKCPKCGVGDVICPGCGRPDLRCPACHEFCLGSPGQVRADALKGIDRGPVWLRPDRGGRWPEVYDGSRWDGQELCFAETEWEAGLVSARVLRVLADHRIGPLIAIPAAIDCTDASPEQIARLEEFAAISFDDCEHPWREEQP